MQLFRRYPKAPAVWISFSQISLTKPEPIGDLTVRYSFLYGPEATYSGMGCYQQYLITMRLKPQARPRDPLLEVIGVAPKIQPVRCTGSAAASDHLCPGPARQRSLAAGVTNLASVIG